MVPPPAAGAGNGTTTLMSVGWRIARFTCPSAALSLAFASPGPENDPQFSDTLIFGFGKTKTLEFFKKLHFLNLKCHFQSKRRKSSDYASYKSDRKSTHHSSN